MYSLIASKQHANLMCSAVLDFFVSNNYMIVLFITDQPVTASLYNHAITLARKQTKTLATQKAARLIVRNLSFKVSV